MAPTLEVFSTISGRNFGLSMYFFSFFRVDSGMLSCERGNYVDPKCIRSKCYVCDYVAMMILCTVHP